MTADLQYYDAHILVGQLTGEVTALLEQYSGECEYNVGAGHVLGALAVEWEELL